MKRTLSVSLVIVAMLFAAASPAGAAVSGNQDFLVVFSGPPGGPGRVGASGTLNAVGLVTTPEGQPPRPFPVVFSFPQGQLFQTVTPTGNDLKLDPQTCVVSGQIFGTYQVTGGTGQLAGASGGGTFAGVVYTLLQRDAQGRCFGPPLAVHQLIRNPGTITLPNVQAA